MSAIVPPALTSPSSFYFIDNVVLTELPILLPKCISSIVACYADWSYFDFSLCCHKDNWGISWTSNRVNGFYCFETKQFYLYSNTSLTYIGSIFSDKVQKEIVNEDCIGALRSCISLFDFKNWGRKSLISYELTPEHPVQLTASVLHHGYGGIHKAIEMDYKQESNNKHWLIDGKCGTVYVHCFQANLLTDLKRIESHLKPWIKIF
jgi:hypothetical protein